MPTASWAWVLSAVLPLIKRPGGLDAIALSMCGEGGLCAGGMMPMVLGIWRIYRLWMHVELILESIAGPVASLSLLMSHRLSTNNIKICVKKVLHPALWLTKHQQLSREKSMKFWSNLSDLYHNLFNFLWNIIIKLNIIIIFVLLQPHCDTILLWNLIFSSNAPDKGRM